MSTYRMLVVCSRLFRCDALGLNFQLSTVVITSFDGIVCCY